MEAELLRDIGFWLEKDDVEVDDGLDHGVR
jgi:hypothetical protein